MVFRTALLVRERSIVQSYSAAPEIFDSDQGLGLFLQLALARAGSVRGGGVGSGERILA